MCVFVGIVGCVLDIPTLLMFRAFFTELFVEGVVDSAHTTDSDDSGIFIWNKHLQKFPKVKTKNVPNNQKQQMIFVVVCSLEVLEVSLCVFKLLPQCPKA